MPLTTLVMQLDDVPENVLERMSSTMLSQHDSGLFGSAR